MPSRRVTAGNIQVADNEEIYIDGLKREDLTISNGIITRGNDLCITGVLAPAPPGGPVPAITPIPDTAKIYATGSGDDDLILGEQELG